MSLFNRPKFKRLLVLSLALSGLVPASGAFASVSLALAGTASTHSGTSVSVTPGSTFQVTVELISTTTSGSDAVCAIDYFLQADTSGIFKLTARNANPTNLTDPFSDVVADDSIVLAPSAATLNPSNGTPGSNDNDLGALLKTQTTPVSNNYPNGTGTFNPTAVATFDIAVALGTPNHNYTLTVEPIGGTTYSAGNYNDLVIGTPPANSPLLQTFVVHVVPEPSSALLIGLGASVVGLRRRR